MKCNNIIYIADSHIALNIGDKIYRLSLNKNILNNGIIIDSELFIKAYLKFYTDNKLSKIFWNKDLTVIYSVLNHKSDLNVIDSIFRDLNYRNINLISEKSKFSLNKKINYLIVDNLLKLFYIDNYNSKKTLVLETALYSPQEVKNLLSKRCKNKELYIIGILDNKYITKDLNYYYFENIDEFFLKNYL